MTKEILAGILTLGVFISCDKSDDSTKSEQAGEIQYVSSVSSEGIVGKTINYKYGGLNNITEINYIDSYDTEAVIKIFRYSIDVKGKENSGNEWDEDYNYDIHLSCNNKGYADHISYSLNEYYENDYHKTYKYNKDGQLIYTEYYSYENYSTEKEIGSETLFSWEDDNLVGFNKQYYDVGRPLWKDEVEIRYSDIKHNTNFNILDIVLDRELSVFGVDLLGVYSKFLPQSISYKDSPEQDIFIEYKLNDNHNPEKITVKNYDGVEVYTIKYMD